MGTWNTPGSAVGLEEQRSPEADLLYEALLEAAEKAGGRGGIVGYLTHRALNTPSAFLALLGTILKTRELRQVRDVRELVRERAGAMDLAEAQRFYQESLTLEVRFPDAEKDAGSSRIRHKRAIRSRRVRLPPV